MSKAITETDFYIEKILNVSTRCNYKKSKPFYVSCRPSDAFFYILSGCCAFTLTDGTVLTPKGGDILYLAKGAAYHFALQTASFRFVLCNFIADQSTAHQSAVFTPQDASEAENVFLRLLHCYDTPTATVTANCMSHAYHIWSLILATANRAEGTPRHKAVAIKSHIDLYYQNPSLSVCGIAEALGISEVYCRRLFKAEYGAPPTAYITAVRIAKAKELLKTSFLTTAECAAQCGFQSLPYFCRVFKKETGQTPAKYRNI